MGVEVGMMSKECGLTYQELSSKVGFLKSLDTADQITLVNIINENNEAIKSYISELIEPKKETDDFATQIVSRLKTTKGMNL